MMIAWPEKPQYTVNKIIRSFRIPSNGKMSMPIEDTKLSINLLHKSSSNRREKISAKKLHFKIKDYQFFSLKPVPLYNCCQCLGCCSPRSAGCHKIFRTLLQIGLCSKSPLCARNSGENQNSSPCVTMSTWPLNISLKLVDTVSTAVSVQ